MILIVKGSNKMNEEDLTGVKKESKLEGYSEKINSKNIISFVYNNPKYYMGCELNNKGEVHVISRGGDISARDGSAFKLDYITNDKEFLNDLQNIVDIYGISNNNGDTLMVSGLPDGYGDMIMVSYDSGEKIYKHSNQCFMISNEAMEAIYSVFHKLAINNGYDFNTEKSNVIIYDDASEEFLQGSWKGSHFGDEILALIQGNYIKVYFNGKLMDDTDYVIINGVIKPNKLKDGIDKAKNEHDYEEFNVFSSLRKKNDILLVAYFTKESYSTAELLIQR